MCMTSDSVGSRREIYSCVVVPCLLHICCGPGWTVSLVDTLHQHTGISVLDARLIAGFDFKFVFLPLILMIPLLSFVQ